jgi:hypothetical protein
MSDTPATTPEGTMTDERIETVRALLEKHYLPSDIGGTLRGLIAEVTRLRTALSAASKDAERVEWMQQNAVHVEPIFDMGPESDDGWRVWPDGYGFIVRDTLRNTLDAAKAGRPELTVGNRL